MLDRREAPVLSAAQDYPLVTVYLSPAHREDDQSLLYLRLSDRTR